MGPLMSVVYAVDLPDEKRGLPAEELAEVLGKILSLCETSGCIRPAAGGGLCGTGGAFRGGEGRCDTGVRLPVLSPLGEGCI